MMVPRNRLRQRDEHTHAGTTEKKNKDIAINPDELNEKKEKKKKRL